MEKMEAEKLQKSFYALENPDGFSQVSKVWTIRKFDGTLDRKKLADALECLKSDLDFLLKELKEADKNA